MVRVRARVRVRVSPNPNPNPKPNPYPNQVHGFYAGVDAMGQFVHELEASDVPLTNGRGAFSASLAEYAITAALHFTKQVPRCMRNREDKVWDKFEMSMLRGKTLGLVGYGDIAKASHPNPSPNPSAHAHAHAHANAHAHAHAHARAHAHAHARAHAHAHAHAHAISRS